MEFGWRIEILGSALAEIENLPNDMQAKFRRIVQMIREFGLHRVHEPYVKHLDGKLWEMRMTGRDGIARAIYITAHGKRVIVLHAFVKKTEKTPSDAMQIARQRAKETVE